MVWPCPYQGLSFACGVGSQENSENFILRRLLRDTPLLLHALQVGDGPVYLSFDIDALDPAFAPGTGTPVSGGLASWQALELMRGLGGLNMVGMDLVEVSPPYDHAEITALAGANVAYDWLCVMAERRQKGLW